jgi:serine/threonine-protein kinase RsbW
MGRPARLTVPGRYDQINALCTFILRGAEEAGFSADERFRIELACDEACTNIIQHAYQGEHAGQIEASWEVTGGDFIITLRDNGRAFDPSSVATPRIPADRADVEGLQVGGLGIHFMRTLMDEVIFRSERPGVNVLIMTKRLPGKGTP